MKSYTSAQRAELCVLPLGVALYRACIDKRGAMAAIAALYGLNQNTFPLKVNPERRGHHLNPTEIENIIEHTRDPRILDSMCASFSNEDTIACWYEMPTEPVNVDGEMLNHFGDLADKVGNLGKTLFATVADGVVDDDEYSALEKASMQLNAAVQVILANARQLRGDR